MIRATLFAPLIGAAFVAAGCGGGSNESATTKWFNNVCGAVTTWQDSITQAGQTLKDSPTKNGVESAYNDAKDATNTLADDLKSAGKPDTQAGGQAKQELDTLAGELGDGVSQMEDAVRGVSSVNEALTAVSAVSGTLATMSTEISTTIDNLRNLDAQGELQTSFNEADSCSSLQSPTTTT
jgi:hypothetical protein